MLAGVMAALVVTTGFHVPVAANAAKKMPSESLYKGILVVEEDMLDDDGELVISGETWDRIVIPKEIDLKGIYFDESTIGEVVVESGSKSDIQFWDAEVGAVMVMEPELSVPDLKELLPLLADVETSAKAITYYENAMAENERIRNIAPSISTMGNAKIGEVVTSANAVLDLANGEVGEVVLSASDTLENVKVTLKNYEGNVSYEGNDSFGRTTLKCVDSSIENLTVKDSGENNYLNITSKGSSAKNVEISGNATVSLYVPTDTLDIKESAAVTVAGKVEELNVSADGAKVEVAPIGNVSVANVAGDNVTVSGSGVLGEAKITGAGATVSTAGTEVEGENSYVYTPNYTEVTFTDIDLVAGDDTVVTKDADGSATVSFEGLSQYRSVTYNVPKSIDKTCIIGVRVEVTTSQQFGLTLVASKGNNIAGYPGYGLSELTEATYSYGVPASSVVSQIQFQSLQPMQADLRVRRITFILKEKGEDEGDAALWTTWTEDFNDDTLLEGILTDSQGALNWGTYERDADGYGKYTCNKGYQGMCVVLDNLDSAKDAEFTVSMKVKKVEGTDTKLKYVDIVGKTYKTYTSSESAKLVISEDEWVTFESSAIKVGAGESFKVNIAPATGNDYSMTFLVDEVTVTRAFLDASSGSDEGTTPTATPTPMPAATAPEALPSNYLVYTWDDLTKDGYGYTLSDAEHGGKKIELSDQYQELQLTLPTAAALADYEKMIVTISSTTDAICVKAGGGNWYNQSATETTDLTFTLADKATADVSMVALMANNAACECVFYRIAFVPKAGTGEGGTPTPTATPSGAVDLTGATKCNTNAWQVHHFTEDNLVEYAGNEITFSVDMVKTSGGTAAIVAQDSAYNAMYQTAEITDEWQTFTYTITVPADYSTKDSAYVGFRWKAQNTDYEDYTFYYKNFTFTGTKANAGEGATPTPTPTPTPTVTVSITTPTTTTLTLDDTLTLAATASNGGTITWSSSAEGVATVDANGKVTPVSGGTVTITATCGSVSDTVDLTIEKAFYLKNAEAFSLTVGSDNSAAVLANYYMNGTNFSGKLPDVLKNDATVKAKFETMSGIVEVVKAFEFSITFTEATKKENSWEPQVEFWVQGNGADGNYTSSTYKNQWVNVGEPTTGGTATGTTTFYVANQTFDDASAAEATWADMALGNLKVTVQNAAAESAVVGTYSIKVILN